MGEKIKKRTLRELKEEDELYLMPPEEDDEPYLFEEEADSINTQLLKFRRQLVKETIADREQNDKKNPNAIYTHYGSNHYFDMNAHYELYKNEKKLVWSKSTHKNSKWIIEPFINWLYENSPNVTSSTKKILFLQQQMNDYIYFLRNSGKSPHTITSQLKQIKSFVNWLYELYGIPKLKITISKNTIPNHRIYSDEELTKLLAPPKMKGLTFTKLRNWAIINFLSGTACRRGSICTVKVGDIDFNNRKIYLSTAKGNKPYDVPLTPSLSKVLLKYINMANLQYDDLLFPSEKNTELKADYITKMIKRYLQAKGIEGNTHAFRHTFAYNYLKEGGDIFSLKTILNHSSLDITQIYANMTNVERIRDTFNKNNLLDRVSPSTTRRKLNNTRSR